MIKDKTERSLLHIQQICKINNGDCIRCPLFSEARRKCAITSQKPCEWVIHKHFVCK